MKLEVLSVAAIVFIKNYNGRAPTHSWKKCGKLYTWGHIMIFLAAVGPEIVLVLYQEKRAISSVRAPTFRIVVLSFRTLPLLHVSHSACCMPFIMLEARPL